LHNHGFLPDKGALFGLSPEMIDPDKPDDHAEWLGQYLSDFQSAVLPLANGRYAAAGSNRLFQWRLHRRVLPLAPLVGSRQAGRVIRHGFTEGPILSLSMDTGGAGLSAWHEDLPEASTTDDDNRVFVSVPCGDETVEITRIAVLHDPRTKLPFVAAAAVLKAPLDMLDAPGATVECRRIDPESGMAGACRRFARGAVAAPETVGEESRIVPGWWPAVTAVLAGLRQLPVWAVIQLDVMDTAEGPLVVDMTDRLDVAALQLEGPMMGTEAAIRFVKEFGV
ncbi:hypothetical protein AB9K41_19140, partial [Cribrihabitans sp. XS_ASV171]